MGVGMEGRSRAMKSWLGQACSLKHTSIRSGRICQARQGTAEQGVEGSLSSYPEGFHLWGKVIKEQRKESPPHPG